jgi:hypothetical protein
MAEDKKTVIHNVTSQNQSGGITAHTVNIGPPPPPEPQLRTVSEEQSNNADGAYTMKRTVEMNAPYEGRLVVTITANGLVRAGVDSLTETRVEIPGNTIIIAGPGRQQNMMQGDNFYTTTIPAPSGSYLITVVTRQKTNVTIDTRFQ